eukprot:348310_1
MNVEKRNNERIFVGKLIRWNDMEECNECKDDQEESQSVLQDQISVPSINVEYQLRVGAGDFSEIEHITSTEIIAQIFVIGYLILAAILMMNLLIALLTTTYERIHISAKTASSFAFAESTYDLSHRSRFMPAPLCIYIFFIAICIHILNFIPSIIYPKYLNIYN